MTTQHMTMMRDAPELAQMNMTNRLLAKEALAHGYDVTFIPEGDNAGGLLIIDTKTSSGKVLMKSTVIRASAGYGVIVARNKLLTHEILSMNGIASPATELYRDEGQSGRFLAAHKTIVVKPLDTNHGLGVTMGITDQALLGEAIKFARLHAEQVLLQQQVEGIDYRLLVVGDRVAAASRRYAARVCGDSRRTIRELIEAENANSLRGDGHSKPMTKIDAARAERYLSEHGQAFNTIPGAGEWVQLAAAANLSQGGEAEDVTGDVHPSIVAMAIAAASACGLAVCGVDVMAPDITACPTSQAPVFVIEVNEAPGIRMHHFPTRGTPRNVAAEILALAIGSAID